MFTCVNTEHRKSPNSNRFVHRRVLRTSLLFQHVVRPRATASVVTGLRWEGGCLHLVYENSRVGLQRNEKGRWENQCLSTLAVVFERIFFLPLNLKQRVKESRNRRVFSTSMVLSEHNFAGATADEPRRWQAKFASIYFGKFGNLGDRQKSQRNQKSHTIPHAIRRRVVGWLVCVLSASISCRGNSDSKPS